MISIPERLLTHVSVVAVSQQSPVASLPPLFVGERPTEATYRVHDNDICCRLQRHTVGLSVEVTLQLPPTQQLQKFGLVLMRARFIG